MMWPMSDPCLNWIPFVTRRLTSNCKGCLTYIFLSQEPKKVNIYIQFSYAILNVQQWLSTIVYSHTLNNTIKQNNNKINTLLNNSSQHSGQSALVYTWLYKMAEKKILTNIIYLISKISILKTAKPHKNYINQISGSSQTMWTYSSPCFQLKNMNYYHIIKSICIAATGA
jgi:hypothetical protein